MQENNTNYRTLPPWILEDIKNLPDVPYLSKKGNSYSVSTPTGTTWYNSGRDAYAENMPSPAGMRISNEVLDEMSTGNSITDSFFFMDTPESFIEDLHLAHDSFLKHADVYAKDPNNFLAAYGFVDKHPAFWVKEPLELVYPGYEWKTSGFVSHFSPHPLENDDGRFLGFLMEGGEVNEDEECFTSFWNLALTVVEPTYEETIIKFAEKVNRDFHLNGTYKPGAMERSRKAVEEYFSRNGVSTAEYEKIQSGEK